jgi:hypothetical protein
MTRIEVRVVDPGGVMPTTSVIVIWHGMFGVTAEGRYVIQLVKKKYCWQASQKRRQKIIMKRAACQGRLGRFSIEGHFL